MGLGDSDFQRRVPVLESASAFIFKFPKRQLLYDLQEVYIHVPILYNKRMYI